MSTPTRRLTVASVTGHSTFRYLLVGGASFLIDFGLLALLHTALGWPLWIATGTAFFTSSVFNYAMQRSFSFGSTENHLSTLVKYLALLAFNTVATIAMVWLVDLGGLGWGVGKVAATIITTGWNYFAFKYWVFRSPNDDSSRS